METILAYLNQTHHPLAIILYGSYADGTAGEGSDFDALLVIPDGESCHDTAEVAGVRLDVWVYPAGHFTADFDPEEVRQIHDGILLSDTDGIGRRVLERVAAHVASLPLPTPDEVRESLLWCRKMLTRAARGDAEGLYRHHWLLSDSLQVAADVLGWPYFGPKKTLRRLQKERPDLYDVYTEALRVFDLSTTVRWISALETYAAG